MNILVLGGGGREHVITWALAQSPKTQNLYVAPGNGGTSDIAQNVPDLDANDGQAVLEFAQQNAIDLVVIGPEAPLVAGVADVLRAAGVAVFGPDAQGAQLEGSKAFSKAFMERYDLPTAKYGVFTDEESALAYVREVGAPIVIEECLTGPECSLFAFVSAGKAHCMSTAQDHKRAFDGDLGPNTGGMGAYSPVPIVTPDQLNAMRDIMERAAAATAQEFDNDYRGVLYGGFMLTPQGPKLLEFNARFGDPETQVVLPRLKSDLVDVMMAVAEGRPEDVELEWSDQWACGVVLASEGYPRAYEKGKVVLGVEDANDLDGVTVFHAGTKVNADGELITSGGRVLNVVAMGDTFEETRDLAYRACDLINFEGKQYRQDIGLKAMKAMEGNSTED